MVRQQFFSHAGRLSENTHFFSNRGFSENKHSHINDIEVYAICEHYFYENNEELGTGKRVYETPQMHSRTASQRICIVFNDELVKRSLDVYAYRKFQMAKSKSLIYEA